MKRGTVCPTSSRGPEKTWYGSMDNIPRYQRGSYHVLLSYFEISQVSRYKTSITLLFYFR